MTNSDSQGRQPAGIPTGGQFATTSHAEATGVTLASDPDDVSIPSSGAPETFEMLWCESCPEAFDESDAARLYECDSCGTKGAERQCPDCKKFRGRSEDPGCPRCEEPVEETLVEMVHDHDGEIIRSEDYEPDGASKAERDKEAKIAAAAQAEVDRAERLAAKKANSAEGTAAAIEPGAVLINPDDDSRFATEAEVLSVRHVETPDGPIVIFKAYDYSLKTVVRRADAAVPVKATVGERPTEGAAPDGSRLTAAHFGGARLVDGFHDRMSSVSSPSNAVDVITGSLARDGGTLPALSLMVGRRSHKGSISGMVSTLGRWDDPDEAAAALDEMERAADAFTTARAEHPPVVSDDEDESWDKTHRVEGWKAVVHDDADWVRGDAQHTIDMTIGYSDWDRDKGALLKCHTASGQNVTFEDPEVLRTAVVEARKHLHTLTGIPTRPDVVDDKI